MTKASGPTRSATAPVSRLFRWCSVSIAGFGAVLLLGSIPSPVGWIDWPITFVVPGAALIGVGYTTLIAQLGLETVFDRRQASLDESTRQNRSRVYEELFRHVIESFGDKTTLTEHAARSKAATWAGTTTLEALANWFQYSSPIGVTLDDAALAERHELVYQVAKAMRNDLELDSSDVERDTILSMIFNDFQ